MPALGGLVSSLAGIAVTVASDPHVLQTVAGKLGVSAAVVGAVVAAVAKSLHRDESERHAP
jgi:hypothetical protein